MTTPRSRWSISCPECGSTDTVRIVYGMPGPDLLAQAERGEIELGGCDIDPSNPNRACKACGHQWQLRGRPKTRRAPIREKPDGIIRGCEFRLRCPQTWLGLTPTLAPSIRYCGECSRDVYLCRTREEVEEAVRMSRCVAVPARLAQDPESSEGHLVGDVGPSYR